VILMRITDRKESPIIGLTGMGGGLASYILYGAAAPSVGDPYGGGYFAGQINDGGTIYNLVVAPLTSGGLEGQLGGLTLTRIQWNISSVGPATTATSSSYGGTATLANANANHPMFNWVVNGATGPNAGTYDATNATGTGIGGYNDWYIPATNELEILYRAFKPDTTANQTTFGANANAVPPTSNYTTTDPAQTTVAIFQSGGSQAFTTDNDGYWSATENTGSNFQSHWQKFLDGFQGIAPKASNKFARAIRRVPV